MYAVFYFYPTTFHALSNIVFFLLHYIYLTAVQNSVKLKEHKKTFLNLTNIDFYLHGSTNEISSPTQQFDQLLMLL